MAIPKDEIVPLARGEIEKINVSLLKNKFLNQSNININKFHLDLNSRTISYNNKKLKLTEREIDIILYLF